MIQPSEVRVRALKRTEEGVQEWRWITQRVYTHQGCPLVHGHVRRSTAERCARAIDKRTRPRLFR